MKKIRISGRFIFDFEQEIEVSDNVAETIDHDSYSFLNRNKFKKEIYNELIEVLDMPDDSLPDEIDIHLVEEIDD